MRGTSAAATKHGMAACMRSVTRLMQCVYSIYNRISRACIMCAVAANEWKGCQRAPPQRVECEGAAQVLMSDLWQTCLSGMPCGDP